MKMNFLKSHTPINAVALLLICGALLNSFAENTPATTVKVGSASIRLVAPGDFSNYSDENDPLRNFAENFCLPENRLLGVFGSKEFGRKALAGESAADFDYALVQVPRAMMWRDTSSRDFADAKREVKQSQDTLFAQAQPDVKDFINRLNRNIEEATGEKITMNLEQPVSLGVFDESSRHVSMMLLMKMQVQAGGKRDSSKVAASVSLMHLRDKVIFVYAYRAYTGEESVAALKKFTADWMAELAKANEPANGQLSAR